MRTASLLDSYIPLTNITVKYFSLLKINEPNFIFIAQMLFIEDKYFFKLKNSNKRLLNDINTKCCV